MIIYPAIDLLNGVCVRLHKGDFAQKTDYSTDPLSVAQGFADAGAQWLHVVDLSGAKDPANRQTTLIEQLAANTSLKIQTGGGVRMVDDVARLLDCGAERVVIGSLAVKDLQLTQQILSRFGSDHIVLALDAIDQYVAVSGWLEATKTTIVDVINNYTDHGLKHILCTDIARDGTLQGPNTDLYMNLTNAYPHLNIQASGGVGSLEDIENLKPAKVSGVIVGKALYENRFSLSEALAAAC